MTHTANPLRHEIVALTSGGPHAWIMINALQDRFGPFPVIQEAAEPSSVFWRRRLRLLGRMKVASMLAAGLTLKLTKRGAQKLIDQMIEQEGLSPDPDPAQAIYPVASVNTEACRGLLSEFAPKTVFVVSTRMIGMKTLNCVEAPFLNYHSGINPAYRGMFGGYFALANGEAEQFGGTMHLVDKGVDTGDVLYQSRVTVDPRDNFHTYIWRIAAGSRSIAIRAVEDALNERLQPVRVNLPSRQYFAPTLGGYLKTGLMRGVW